MSKRSRGGAGEEWEQRRHKEETTDLQNIWGQAVVVLGTVFQTNDK